LTLMQKKKRNGCQGGKISKKGSQAAGLRIS
jgi:hypothetical protein